MIKGLPPVWNPSCRILILGSFPSVKSRNYFYYGNPQNRFWSVLSTLLAEIAPPTPSEKTDWLLAHRIALWDVVGACDIVGSNDMDITIYDPAQINDVSTIVNGMPNLVNIYCNGQKAYELYNRYIFPNTSVKAVLLPSTSPQNTSFRIDRWRAIQTDLYD